MYNGKIAQGVHIKNMPTFDHTHERAHTPTHTTTHSLGEGGSGLKREMARLVFGCKLRLWSSCCRNENVTDPRPELGPRLAQREKERGRMREEAKERDR